MRYAQACEQLSKNPKKWLVTGAAGFIGSNLAQRLLELDQEVVGLDNFSTGYQRNLDDIASIIGAEKWRHFQFIEGDVRNCEACSRAVSGVDYVLHQAALGSVPRSIADPQASHQSNVDGFVNVFLAAKDAGVRRFVYASSSSVYGDSPELPKREERVGNPLSPYAATKAIDEVYAGVFARVYGFGAIGLRYFNVFGARQDPNGAYAAVIPRWIAALIKGERCTIFGDGETSRDFCYIENVVQANILAALAENPGACNQAYNVAVGEHATLLQLFELISSNLSRIYPEQAFREPAFAEFRSGDIRHSLADISKAQELLDYEPVVRLGDGVSKTVEWFAKRGR